MSFDTCKHRLSIFVASSFEPECNNVILCAALLLARRLPRRRKVDWRRTERREANRSWIAGARMRRSEERERGEEWFVVAAGCKIAQSGIRTNEIRSLQNRGNTGIAGIQCTRPRIPAAGNFERRREVYVREWPQNSQRDVDDVVTKTPPVSESELADTEIVRRKLHAETQDVGKKRDAQEVAVGIRDRKSTRLNSSHIP